jgi:hypothetical protein
MSAENCRPVGGPLLLTKAAEYLQPLHRIHVSSARLFELVEQALAVAA